MTKPPSYDGSGLVNLMAEIEDRMRGESESPGLTDTSLIPDASSFVLVLFDGLGTAQLDHESAGAFRSTVVGTLDAPFPTTTSVSLATVATGLAPSQHGQVAHLTWIPEVETVVNSLKWLDLTGSPVPYPYATFLPGPNLWERLRQSGVEPITVQPGDFAGSPLTRVLYRGARFEGAWDVDDIVEGTIQLAKEPGRFIFSYVPHVDFAGHVYGLESEEFTEAMSVAVDVWERLIAGLPPDVALIGTSDHGLAEFPEEKKMIIRQPEFSGLRFAGDTRGVQLWGDPAVMAELADLTGGVLVDPLSLIGPDPADTALARVGEKVLLPPDDVAVIPKGFDKRLRCYHGGLSRAELEIPLLVA